MRRDAEAEVADERGQRRPRDEEVVVRETGAGDANAQAPERRKCQPQKLSRKHDGIDETVRREREWNHRALNRPRVDPAEIADPLLQPRIEVQRCERDGCRIARRRLQMEWPRVMRARVLSGLALMTRTTALRSPAAATVVSGSYVGIQMSLASGPGR